MIVCGIDPGPTESAYVLIDQAHQIIEARKTINAEVEDELWVGGYDEVAIESMQSYGMPVGQAVFQTSYLIGRLQLLAEQRLAKVALYPRPLVAGWVTGGAPKRGDSVVRQALELRFGGYKKGEPLHQLRNTDLRSAFAVAAYHLTKVVRDG